MQSEAVHAQYAGRFRRYLTPWKAQTYAGWWIFLCLLFSVTRAPMVVTLLLAAIAAAVGGRVIVPRINQARTAHNDAATEEVSRLAGPQLEPINSQLAIARAEFDAHFRDRFPERYLTLGDVAACWQLVHDHRASTVPDLINTYETELHRRRLENMASAQLAETERVRQATQLGNVINAVGHIATVGAIRHYR